VSPQARATAHLPARADRGRQRQDAIARALERLAAAPGLLVMCDFDGTIAAICRDPQRVAPDPAAIAALEGLAELPRTSVTVISGRGLADLRARIGARDHVRLVGSYGLEVDGDKPVGTRHSARAQRIVSRIERMLSGAVRAVPGARIERKAMSVALHVRGLPRADAKRAIALARRSVAISGVRAVPGRSIMEWCAFTPCKATAIREIVGRRDRRGVLCIGDDHGDVGALAMVHGWGGVAISVGRRRAGVPLRVGGVPDVSRALAMLLQMRRASMAVTQMHLASARARTARVATARARAHGRSGASAPRA
jgi:trehalose 6-phosphate phosphatase